MGFLLFTTIRKIPKTFSGLDPVELSDVTRAAHKTALDDFLNGGETFNDITKQTAENADDTAMTAPQPTVNMAEDGHYSAVITPAPIITIHDDADDKVVTTETIIPETCETDCEQAITADSAESVIHVKAVILPKESIQVTEISGNDDEPVGDKSAKARKGSAKKTESGSIDKEE